MSPMIDRCQALVLNADFQPLSYFPLSLWPWQEGVKAVLLERVSVVLEYDQVIHLPTRIVRLPSVIALKEYILARRYPAFTRFNVFLRDGFSCQYCGEHLPTSDLTFDHVIPRSRRGRTTWTNVVTVCTGCNLAKGSRLPQEAYMFPRTTPPHQPTAHMLQERRRAFPPNYLHKSWRNFLSKIAWPLPALIHNWDY